MSSHFVWLNRSKESITLDLKHPDALEVMHRLLEHADVFVQNFAPSAAERLGLGDESLRARLEVDHLLDHGLWDERTLLGREGVRPADPIRPVWSR